MTRQRILEEVASKIKNEANKIREEEREAATWGGPDPRGHQARDYSLRMALKLEEISSDLLCDAERDSQSELRPLDLSNLLKHAFLSGFVAAKDLPAHESYNDIESWVEYDPTGCSAYNRIVDVLKE